MRFTSRTKKDYCFCDFDGHHTYEEMVEYILKSKFHIDVRKFGLRYFHSNDKDSCFIQFFDEITNNQNSLEFNYVAFSIAETINENFYKRLARLRERVRSMLFLGHDVSFVTLTFTDDVLASTSPETRRRYVSRWFGNFENHYVANIDFGTEKGREHYHGLVVALPDSEPYDTFNGRPCYGFHIDAPIINKWQYGIYDAEVIRYTDDDVMRLTTYINKLTHHAMKETTKGSRIIYDRIPFVNKSIKTLLAKKFVDKTPIRNPYDEHLIDFLLKAPSPYLVDIETNFSVSSSVERLKKLRGIGKFEELTESLDP